MVQLADRQALPDKTRLDVPVGSVYVTAEESISKTVVPRLIKADATNETLRKMRIIGYVKDDRDGHARPLNLEDKRDLALLERAIDQVDAKLVVIDPITRDSRYVGFLQRSKNATRGTKSEREEASIEQTRRRLVNLFTQDDQISIFPCI